MTDKTRRNVLRYGIAVALVITATGVAMLFATSGPVVLCAIFVSVAALSSWKGGWSGAVTAIGISIPLLAFLFGVSGLAVLGFVIASLVGSAVVIALVSKKRRRATLAAPEALPLATPEAVTFDRVVLDRGLDRETVDEPLVAKPEAIRAAAGDIIEEHEPEREEAAQQAVASAGDNGPPSATTASWSGNEEGYTVVCFTCRSRFDANDADWCGCLTKRRTLVCTNCLTCFCKAPPAYAEAFWLGAPPGFFERKSAEARQRSAVARNPPPDNVGRPLVLSVDDDEAIQLIVQRVCLNLGYGFIHAENGRDGLALARRYRPNLILSNAFLSELDGREMCRILRDEAAGADCTMVIMTGLYVDTKYRSEARERFRVDDYVSQPVAITDLISLLQRYLQGVIGLPQQEDLHELHRASLEERGERDGIVRASVSNGEAGYATDARRNNRVGTSEASKEQQRTSDRHDVSCLNCGEEFDAARAAWCKGPEHDQTLVCPHCGLCFCGASSLDQERFWTHAPPVLFERKMILCQRNVVAGQNPSPEEMRRPLILLVEDDENLRLIVRTVATLMGFGLVVAADGPEGLALARRCRPDLILLDALTPRLDGWELSRLLKEDATTTRATVVTMTGLSGERHDRKGTLDHFSGVDFLAKPLVAGDVIDLLRKHLPQDRHPAM